MRSPESLPALRGSALAGGEVNQSQLNDDSRDRFLLISCYIPFAPVNASDVLSVEDCGFVGIRILAVRVPSAGLVGVAWTGTFAGLLARCIATVPDHFASTHGMPYRALFCYRPPGAATKNSSRAG